MQMIMLPSFLSEDMGQLSTWLLIRIVPGSLKRSGVETSMLQLSAMVLREFSGSIHISVTHLYVL